MTVSRKGHQITSGKSHRSHASGRGRGQRFSQKIKENLEKQVTRLEKELCKVRSNFGQKDQDNG